MSKKDFLNLYQKYCRDELSTEKYAGKSSTQDEPPVFIRGNDIPDPNNFFSKTLTKHITPTKVQRHAIPMIMAGRDVIGCAQGGTGVFVVPIVHGVIQSTRYPSIMTIVRPVALILCPTVENAEMIFDKFKKVCRGTSVKLRSGEEVDDHKQPHKKSFDVDILVATPQQILKILNVPELVDKARLVLRNVKYLALEEAHELLSKFHMDILRIINNTDMQSGSRQTMFFGETFAPQLQELASEFLKPDYIFFCERKHGSGKFTCEDFRTENDSSVLEYSTYR